ncbi:MAG: tRNA (N6-threonylcarbamoyladenosine(37)-N6)-methyltransferase TrmO [archaeon]|nr:tRNA (N6-threonylcarbamoyladenosine(37)-N6)-methyltransferase TrmO [archaeon]MCP8305932.1 tRNA (N6-threonylcarbamoyladenosine(37)-N6)-methyltransferase TrmO [archaeon]
MMSEEIKFRPIGYVKTDSDEDLIKVDREKVVSKVILFEEFTEALDGVEDFSHLFIIFHLHKVVAGRSALKVHPRRRSDLPLVGVFATRSPYRPNPIGLTLVELIERKGNIVKVKGLDAIDGTPVIDVKPYFPPDAALEVRTPEWLMKLRRMNS